jgi:molecular chaperone GrpE (heat shock protein)
MLEAAQDLGKSRHTAALTLTNARMNSTAKENEVAREKSKGAGSGKIAQLEVELNQIKAKQEVAQKGLDRFTENIESEVDNFHNHRVSDLKAILGGYASAAHKLANSVAKQRASLTMRFEEL